MAPHRRLRNIPAFLSLGFCAAACLAQAQSIAASLSGYEATLRVASVAGVSAKSFSGVAFHPGTRTLYVIDNDNAVIYELSTSGILLRSLATSGFTDPEGIAYQADDFFFIAEEGLANIVRIKLPRAGTGPVPRSGGVALNISPNLANSGIEGVAYCAAHKTAYAVKEINPARLYRIGLDAAGNPNASFPNQPFDIEGKSGDAADIHALDDGNFLIVNQEQNRLEGYGPQGQALSSLPLGMGKPEGIAVDTATGTIYIVGEPLELGVFKRKGAGTRNAIASRKGFACSAVPGEAFGAAPVLRFSLPYRTSVRIEYIALDGARTEVFRGMMDPGDHRYRSDRSVSAAGIGFYRFSAGPFHRMLRTVSAGRP